jgi:hypothetical protein
VDGADWDRVQWGARLSEGRLRKREAEYCEGENGSSH